MYSTHLSELIDSDKLGLYQVFPTMLCTQPASMLYRSVTFHTQHCYSNGETWIAIVGIIISIIVIIRRSDLRSVQTLFTHMYILDGR